MIDMEIVLVLLCSVLCLGASQGGNVERNATALCSQICHNENGTFSSACVDGCLAVNRSTAGNVSLVVGCSSNIFEITLDGRKTVMVNDTQYTLGIDYIYRTGVIYWCQFESGKIYKTSSNNEGNDITYVISDTLKAPLAVAVDWIYNHIYWTDIGCRPSVGVANLDGTMIKSLITKGVYEPRDIVVNPLEGWLFWSDKGQVTKIERAGLDGTHRQIIISTDIILPVALTLDLVQRRVYWVDATLHVISSCDYDGSRRRQILHDKEALGNVIAIDVFKNHVYWTNYKIDTIYQANKFNGSHLSVLGTLRMASGLKVLHPSKQPDGVNHCGPDNRNCSHLCLPAPQVNQHSPKTTCACPDEMILKPGGLKCDKETIARMERTLVAVTQDGIQRGFFREISKRRELAIGRFTVVVSRNVRLTEELMKNYPDISSKQFFLGLLKNVSSNPVHVMAWEGMNAVDTFRSIYPQASDPGAIKEGTQAGRNIVYCSESLEAAKKDYDFWFNESLKP